MTLLVPALIVAVLAVGAAVVLYLRSRTIAAEAAELVRAREADAAALSQLQSDRSVLADALPATMADVARRGMSLVSRLMDQIEQMQEGESDPARLEELYRLDHLSLRLRRESENLLVVADAPSDMNADEPPMLVVDVARLAASATEGFTRVEVDPSVEGAVAGWAVQPLALAVSALLDNALRFSPPERRVTLTGEWIDGGLMLVIRDHGIGMDEANLQAARVSLSAPPLTHVARTRRLGLFVTGMIAKRLGALVDLRLPADGKPGLEAVFSIPDRILDDAPSARPVTPQGRRLTAVPDVADDLPSADALPTAGAAPGPVSAPAPSAPAPSATPAAHNPWTDFGAPAAPAAPTGQPTAPSDDPAHDPIHIVAATPESEVTTPAAEQTGRSRRAAQAWSIAMPGAGAPGGGPPPAAQPAEPDVAFVNDTNGWAPRPVEVERPIAPAVVAANLAATPQFVPREKPSVYRIPDRRTALAQPADHIPPIIENPLVDIMPDHPTALLVAPREVTVLAATVLEGIVMPGEQASAPVSLPTREASSAAAPVSVANLFGALAHDDADDDDEFSALSDLTEAGDRA